ncbi:VanZ family protein, partial [bacterium]|nr:VanZ family protein [bacterium]
MTAAIERVGARWWLLGALLLLVPFVVPVPGQLERMHVVRSFGVIAHFGLPFALVLLLYRYGPLKGSLGAAAVLAFLLAAGCEIPQLFVGRHPRLQDAGVDLGGVVSAAGLLLHLERGRRWALLIFLAGLAVLAYQV